MQMVPPLGGLKSIHIVDDINPTCTLRTLNYGNYGLVLILGNAGFISSTVGPTLGYLGPLGLGE